MSVDSVWFKMVENDLQKFSDLYMKNPDCKDNPELIELAINCLDHIPFLLLELQRYREARANV